MRRAPRVAGVSLEIRPALRSQSSRVALEKSDGAESGRRLKRVDVMHFVNRSVG
jgi:hypothetical protein